MSVSRRIGLARRLDLPAAGQIGAGERLVAAQQFRGRALKHHLAAALAGAGTDVDDAVRGLHHLRVVLHHQQRVALIAQSLKDRDQAVDIARVQTDARLVEYEQGVDQ